MKSTKQGRRRNTSKNSGAEKVDGRRVPANPIRLKAWIAVVTVFLTALGSSMLVRNPKGSVYAYPTAANAVSVSSTNTSLKWSDLTQKTQQTLSAESRKAGVYSRAPTYPQSAVAHAELLSTDNQDIGFTGYVKDTESGLYYAKARYYDPRVGRFMTADPEEGNPMQPPSLHQYLYAYANPTVYSDPSGRATEAQYAELMQQSIAAWQQGNRTALGRAGELHLEKLLEKSGQIIIKGPTNNPGEHNADIVAYDPEAKKLSFFDNKIQTAKETVSASETLSTLEGRGKAIAQANQLAENLNVDKAIVRDLRNALQEVGENHALADWVVANANPSETSVGNLAKRVSVRLAEKGVRFADISNDEKISIRSLEESVGKARGAKQFIAKAAKAIPVVGMIVVGTDAAARTNDALREDFDYGIAMRELGGEPRFPFQSTEQVGAQIGGEQAGGAGGATLGGEAGTICGPLAWVCVPSGVVIGGFAGTWIGGKVGGKSFDAATHLSEEEIARIYREARAKIDEQSKAVVVGEGSGRL